MRIRLGIFVGCMLLAHSSRAEEGKTAVAASRGGGAPEIRIFPIRTAPLGSPPDCSYHCSPFLSSLQVVSRLILKFTRSIAGSNQSAHIFDPVRVNCRASPPCASITKI